MARIITLTPNPTYDFAVDADFVEPNRKLRCHNAQSHPGGGGVNVAGLSPGRDSTITIRPGAGRTPPPPAQPGPSQPGEEA